VLVGVGIADQQVDDAADGVGAIELMVRAVRAAADDAGAPALLRAVEQIAVPQGTWKHVNPARDIAVAVGSPRARTMLAELGVPQQTLVNEALRAITAGDLDVALIVGGESKRRDTLAERAGIELPAAVNTDAEPDERLRPTLEIVAQAEIDARAVVPVQQYALIENALRTAEGRTFTEQRDEIAALWSSFNRVAVDNPHAAFREPRDAAFLREPSATNRPLAFPYNKWHVTQWTVDQAAASLLCSSDAARAHGIDPSRWVFPLVGLESSDACSLSRRRDLHRWPAMDVLGRAASAHLGRPVADIEHQDLYSCFPVAVRVQQRELGLDLDGVPTVTGGMAFAGGPFNNYVLQSTSAMITRLREHPGDLGLISTVSGLLTKPGLAIWSTEPGDGAPLIADLAADAAAETATVESVAGYAGPATIATYTVTYEGQTPTRVLAIGDTPDGQRCVAVCEDADLATRATEEDLTGATIQVDGPRFTN